MDPFNQNAEEFGSKGWHEDKKSLRKKSQSRYQIIE
jgi:hypothetical protein